MSNSIRNIWNEVKVDLKKNKITPVDILQKQAKAINEDVEKTNIAGLVMSISIGTNDVISEIKHTLYLLPKNGNDYNYRFIELVSKPDVNYPLTVYAYQSGNTNFGECKNEEELYEV